MRKGDSGLESGVTAGDTGEHLLDDSIAPRPVELERFRRRCSGTLQQHPTHR